MTIDAVVGYLGYMNDPTNVSVTASSTTTAERPRAKMLRMLAQQKKASKFVAVVIGGDSMVVEVRCPGIEERRAITMKFKDDNQKTAIYGVTRTTYECVECEPDDPKGEGVQLGDGKTVMVKRTNTRLFEETDLDALMADPTGGFVDVIAKVYNNLIETHITEAWDAAKK